MYALRRCDDPSSRRACEYDGNFRTPIQICNLTRQRSIDGIFSSNFIQLSPWS